jgi:TetR/AcrR family transcriptional regulator, transcriptional repressor for nem operon
MSAVGSINLSSAGWQTRFNSLTDDDTLGGYGRRKKGLADFIDYYLSTLHRDAQSRGCALAALSSDIPRLAEAAHARFTEGMERLSGAIGKLLKKLNVQNADALALSAVSEIVGSLALSRAVPDPKLSEQILRTSRDAVKARLGLE